MRVTIDYNAHAVYIDFLEAKDQIQYHGRLVNTQVDGNILIDYTDDGKLFGIEILSPSILDIDELKHVEFRDMTGK